MITTNSISIALANNNVEWSNKYDNVILFNNDSEILSYLGITDADFKPYNFPLFSSTKPRDVVIDLSSTNKNVYDIVNSNYFVAKLETSDGKTKYYYYFVNSATQSTQTTFVLTLTLDVFTTYKLNVDFQVKNVLTERKHCNRFNVYENRLYFKNDSGSEVMYEDDLESVEQPKKLTNIEYFVRDKYNHVGDRTWLYLYVSLPVGIAPSSGLQREGYVKTGNLNSSTSQWTLTNYIQNLPLKIIRNTYAILVAPLYPIKVKNIPYPNMEKVEEQQILVWRPDEFERSANNLIQFFSKGNATKTDYIGTFKIYGANMGSLPPLPITYESDGTIDFQKNFGTERGNYPANNKLLFIYYKDKPTINSTNIYAPFLIKQNMQSSGGDIAHDFDLEIRGANGKITGIFNKQPSRFKTEKDIELEPKLYKSAFRNIKLKQNNCETFFDYPILNVLNITRGGGSGSTIIFWELPTPEGVINFTALTTADYYRLAQNSLIGLSAKNIFSIPITDDAYTNYLLNNKNAVLTGLIMPQINNAYRLASGVAQSALNITSAKKPSELSQSIFGMVDTIGSGVLDIVNTGVNFNAKMDNLRSTPDNLKYLQTNSLEALLIASIEFAPFIEVWEAYDNIMEKAFDFFYAFGYKINRITSSNEWNNRYYFNFIKTAESSESKIISTMPLSLEIKNLISSALQNGITFWNYTSDFVYLDYTMENWENDLL